MINIRSMVLSVLSTIALTVGAQVSMTHNVTSYYEPQTAKTANYYLVVSDNPTAKYNSKTGLVTMTGEGYLLALDLYAPVSETKPIVLPVGTYTANDSQASFTYSGDADLSYLMKYNSYGNASATAGLQGSVIVELGQNDAIQIKVSSILNGQTVDVTFSGSIVFEDTEESPFVFPQLKKNIDETFTHAVAVYDGNLYETNTGAFYLSLCTCEADSTTGAMKYPNNTRVAVMLFNRLFGNSKDAYVEPGTYTVTRSMKRDTFYPGIEVDYMGLTIPFGSYVQQHCPGVFDDSSMGYSYLTDGTLDVKRDNNGVYDITLDLKTSYGHSVTGSFHGTIHVHDQAEKKGGAKISTLESDVECQLDQIEIGRLQYNGLKNNNCHSLILDIGAPNGKDQSVVDNGGDIIRFEMLQSADKPFLVEGNYTVTEQKWDTYYAPFKLVQGRFHESANGDLTGTRYEHFIPGRYMVMDHLAPAIEGTMALNKNIDGTWNVKFALIDDGYFRISGEWNGPIEYFYDPQEVMAGTISSHLGCDAVEIEHIDADRIRLNNLSDRTPVSVFSMSGLRMDVTADADGVIRLTELSSGVYILRVAGKAFKITK